jgi:transcriptional regulator with XRE-family HTH domain
MQDSSTRATPGQVIQQARKAAELSREKLAAEAGVSTSTIVRLERQEQLPNVAALVRIAARLSVPVTDLLPDPERAA